MSDSDIEIISGPPQPQPARDNQRPNQFLRGSDDDLIAVELSSYNPRRRRRDSRPPVVANRPARRDPESSPPLFVDDDPIIPPLPATDDQNRRDDFYLRSLRNQALLDQIDQDIEDLQEQQRQWNRELENRARERRRRLDRHADRRRRDQSHHEGIPNQVPQDNHGHNFIDLTEEPDSPDRPVPLPLALPRILPNQEGPRARNVGFLDIGLGIRNNSQNSQSSQNSSSRNPRRQMSQLGRTPSLARSDASINGGRGGQAMIIDLTEIDDPPEPAAAQPAANPRGFGPLTWLVGARNVLAQGQAQPPGNGQAAQGRGRALMNMLGRSVSLSEIRNMGGHGAAPAANGGNNDNNNGRDAPGRDGVDDLLRQGINGFFDPLFGDQQVLDVEVIQLDYRNNVPAHFWEEHRRPDQPKPAYVPAPEVPDGYSRETGEDVVAVCPGCDDELVYDPDAEAPAPPPTKKARTKKDRAEHHFMAVKTCGHVFCRMCYEDRKRKALYNKTNHNTSGFQIGAASKNTVICAVDGCDTDVSNKSSWVGVFV